MMTIPLFHWLSSLLLASSTAHAAGLTGVITSVGAGMATSFSGTFWSGGVPGIADGIVSVIWMIILPIGTLLIVRAGLSLIVSEDENKFSTAKRTISATLMGIIMIRISQQLVVSFYGDGGGAGGLMGGGQTTLQSTIYGLANWFLVTMAALGAFIIVVSVIRAIGSFGKEEELTNVRQTIFGVASGILMISLLPAIKLTLGIRDLSPLGAGSTSVQPTSIIREVAGIVSNLLVFLSLIAVAIIIYAGIRMIVNLGNDEEFGKSKGLIIRAMVGLVVILLSYTAVVLIFSLGTGSATPVI